MTVSGNLVQQRLLCSLDVGKELLLKLGDLCGVDLVQESPDTAVNDGNLVLDGHGHVLTLLQQLSQPHASAQQLLGGSVKIRTERKQRPLCTGPTRASWNQRPASWTWSEQQN